jgi:oleate hydratase
MSGSRRAFLIGGGIGSLAAAAFMVRDGGLKGNQISVLEATTVTGGCIDAAGNPDQGYIMKGSRMMTADNFECTWGLFQSIPSLSSPGRSVFEETMEFSEKVPWNAKARLIDRNRAVVDTTTMGFSMVDRIELLRLSQASEQELEGSRITDWLSPAFFETNFWQMWATTFAFQPWHSALELRRYMHRFIKSFSRIDKMSGVKHPVYNHYDSFIRPLTAWLESHGVQFKMDTTVTDLDLVTEDGMIRVTRVHYRHANADGHFDVGPDDVVVLQNGSMTAASSIGSMNSAPPRAQVGDSKGWALWEKLAEGRPEFGRPSAFKSSIPETYWQSFTVTLGDSAFFDEMEKFTGNAAGTGGIVTFKDSRWLLSIVLYHQPHFVGQPENVQVFWGYALRPDHIGDFVAKPMSECSGREVLRELCGHIKLDERVFAHANCIPCRMPYITSQFMPRRESDRPLPVPKNSRNLAFVSQFVEIPQDVVFTIEYSIRAAQIAVYELLKIDRDIPPINPHDKSVRQQIKAIIKAFK